MFSDTMSGVRDDRPGLAAPRHAMSPVLKNSSTSRRNIAMAVVKREPLDGHLSRDDISHWPHSLRPAGYYTSEGRIHVPI
jgi:hypothetical protein